MSHVATHPLKKNMRVVEKLPSILVRLQRTSARISEVKTNSKPGQQTKCLVLASVSGSSLGLWKNAPPNGPPLFTPDEKEEVPALKVDLQKYQVIVQKSELESDLQRIGLKEGIVLNHLELSLALTWMKKANAIRDGFQALVTQPPKELPPALWSLIHEMCTKNVDEFLVLPLTEICSNCEGSDPPRRHRQGQQQQHQMLVGVFSPYAGQEWSVRLPPDSPLGRKEIQMIKHVICALLVLHLVGVQHHGINKHTILIDHLGVARLAFPEQMSLPTASESTTPTVTDNDWQALADLLSQTWHHNLAHHPPEYSKLFVQIINLLKNESSDQQALLAFTLLSNKI